MPNRTNGGRTPAACPRPRWRRAALAEAMLDAQAEALMQNFIDLAMQGDKTCMTLLIERILPLKWLLDQAPEPMRPAARAARPADLRARELDALDAAYGPEPEAPR